MSKQAVKYTRQTKSEYMKKLQHIFRSSEFINLRFADNQVRKSGVGGEIYGIQIKQDYFSSSYGDTGLLDGDLKPVKARMATRNATPI